MYLLCKSQLCYDNSSINEDDDDNDDDDEHWKANHNGVTGLASRVTLNFSFFS